MATPQCPSCARFLARAFVAGLAEAQAPCPGCGMLLGPDALSIGDDAVAPRSPEADVEQGETDDVIVLDEPPASRDPLEGWDVGVPVPAPLGDPPDGLQPEVAGVATAAGLVLGAAVAGRGRRVRGALLGALLGLLAAAARVLVAGD